MLLSHQDYCELEQLDLIKQLCPGDTIELRRRVIGLGKRRPLSVQTRQVKVLAVGEAGLHLEEAGQLLWCGCANADWFFGKRL